MKEKLINILAKKWVVPAGIGVIAFSAGSSLAYILLKRGEKDSPIEEVSNENKIDENQLTIFDEIESKVSNVIEDILDNRLKTIEEAIPNPESSKLIDIQLINVFKNNDDQWDYEAELSIRSKDAPYVIHQDEFIQDEMGFDQSTITYYSGDDIMSDQSDVPIYNYSTIIAPLKFGHGSNDQSVVYIRNERLQQEWEVMLHPGKFEVEVLGLDIENKYESRSSTNSVLKFRDE